jgi:hypothetical protein
MPIDCDLPDSSHREELFKHLCLRMFRERDPRAFKGLLQELDAFLSGLIPRQKTE